MPQSTKALARSRRRPACSRRDRKWPPRLPRHRSPMTSHSSSATQTRPVASTNGLSVFTPDESMGQRSPPPAPITRGSNGPIRWRPATPPVHDRPPRPRFASVPPLVASALTGPSAASRARQHLDADERECSYHEAPGTSRRRNAVIWLPLRARERPNEKPLDRRRVGNEAEATDEFDASLRSYERTRRCDGGCS